MRLRQHTDADLDWLCARQIGLYRAEYGYGPAFAGHVVASIEAFRVHEDPERDRVWIAQGPAGPAGAIAIQHDPDRPGWAKLRWYLVEPDTRGQGLGTRLIDTAMAWALACHDGVSLWTCSDLDAARRQYERHGFRLVEEADCPWKAGIVQQRYERAF